MKAHFDWYQELKEQNPAPEAVHQLVQQDVGRIFSEILGNAGVYKDTDEGREAFRRFCQHVNRKL